MEREPTGLVAGQTITLECVLHVSPSRRLYGDEPGGERTIIPASGDFGV